MWTEVIENLAIILIGLGVGIALVLFLVGMVREMHRRDQHPWSIWIVTRVRTVYFPRLMRK